MRTLPLSLVALALAFGCMAAGGSAAAQSLDRFRSFSAVPPTISDEITITSAMDSPQGRYRVVDQRSIRQAHTYQIDRCRRIPSTPRLRHRLQGQRYVRCRVLEINQTLSCEHCSPQVLTFEDVTFARYTSPVTEEDGRPVIDNWVGYVSIGSRHIRILIEEERFIVQEWGSSDPNMGITEAPVRRL
jgi:hypothetical protein